MSSVKLAALSEKALLISFATLAHSILTVYLYFSFLFHFGFGGGILILIVSVSGLFIIH